MATFFSRTVACNKADGTLPQSLLSPPHPRPHLSPLTPLILSTASCNQSPSVSPLSPYRKPEMLCTARRMGHTPSPLGCQAERGQEGRWLCPNRWRQLAAKSCFYRYVCTHSHAYICTHIHIWQIYVNIHISVRFTPSSTPQPHFAISFRPSVPYPRCYVTFAGLAALRSQIFRSRIAPCPPQFPCSSPTPSICPRCPVIFSAYVLIFIPATQQGRRVL